MDRSTLTLVEFGRARRRLAGLYIEDHHADRADAGRPALAASPPRPRR